jgi:predicted nucleotidyltransferase
LIDRHFPTSMDRTIVAEIDGRLADIKRHHNVSIPLAVESGSRAWGFPSPDSDYDCRFVFVRAVSETFTLFPERDVIETPLTPILDVNGWELSKALKLLLKGNVVVVEWLTSPLVYQCNSDFRAAFLEIAGEVADRSLTARHYYHLAANHLDRFLSAEEDVPLKKLFYALRPLMALKWLEENPNSVIAPMNFPSLCAGVPLELSVVDTINELMARKAETRELGNGPIPLPIRAFLTAEFPRMQFWKDGVQERRPGSERLLDAFWREWTHRLAPGE